MLNRNSQGFLDVSKILRPKSVAVIGASDRVGNFGGATVERLLRFGFPGPVWPVNCSGEPVCGQRSYASVKDLPGVAELAIFAIPAEALPQAIGECAAAGTMAGIAYAGGLAENGPAGAALQRVIEKTCEELGFALCGPNCLGVINTVLPVAATFATALDDVQTLPTGGISMMTQSGGIGTTAFLRGLREGFAFRYVISSGNEAIADFSDYLFALAHDEGTRVIAGYLEGIKDGAKFIRALEAARQTGKPVVLIKAGASPAGAKAALAHTGSLVGEDRVFDAVLQEFGVARAYSIQELVEVASVAVSTPSDRRFGTGIGIVTFGGGNGVLAADQSHQHGLRTPPLTAETVDRLKPLLASVATAANPVDLTPTTAFRPELLANLPNAMTLLAEQADIDVVLVIVGTMASKANEIIDAIEKFVTASPKPVCVSWPSPPAGVPEKLAARNIFCFEEPASAVRTLGRLARAHRSSPEPAQPHIQSRSTFDWHPVIGEIGTEKVVPEHLCHDIMRRARLSVAPGGLATDEASVVELAVSIGFPIALKGISRAVTHRAAAGLVLLNLQSAADIRQGWQKLQRRAQELEIELEGVFAQKMFGGGSELLIAATRDPLFGTIVSCGSGGVVTELIDDVVSHRAPVTPAIAGEMIRSLRAYAHAHDEMGTLPVDEAAAFLARFSELAADAPWTKFVFEANPVKWTRERAVAVDGLLIIEEV